jgi:hypothetical protein
MSFHRNAKLGLAGRYALVCAIAGGMTVKGAAAGEKNSAACCASPPDAVAAAAIPTTRYLDGAAVACMSVTEPT